jgi:hypothetical protein
MKKLAATVSAFLGTHALASQCVMQAPERIAASAQVAFVGIVTAVQESPYKPSDLCWARSREAPQCGGKLVTLQVTESLRGRVSSRTTVVSEDACYCLGSYWKVGSSYLIVASRNYRSIPGDVIAGNVCSGTGELNEMTLPIVKALRSAKP